MQKSVAKALTTSEGSRRPVECLVPWPQTLDVTEIWGAGGPEPTPCAQACRWLSPYGCSLGEGQRCPSSGTTRHARACQPWPANGSCLCPLLPVLVLWAEGRSGVCKPIKELLREKWLDHPYDEWLKRNREKPGFSLASSKNANICFVPDICVCSKKSPRKEALAFLHLEAMKKAWELSLLFS